MARRFDARAWACRSLVVALVVPLGCGSSPEEEHVGVSASPIVGGTASDDTQDAVVLVIHATAASSTVEVCSGTLLAPTLVLTARHCVAPVDPSVTCTSDGTAVSGGHIASDFTPTDMFVYGGSQRAGLGTVLTVAVQGSAIIDDSASTLCNHDLALIVLSHAVPGTKIAPVRLSGETNAGELTTLVGWGIDDTGNLTRTRQQRTDEAVLAVGPAIDLGLGSSELLIGRGACQGDSGGPALAASGAVIGLLSRGGTAGPSGTEVGCNPDDIGLYTAPSGFSELLLAGYQQVGQEPWLEGKPNPTLATLGSTCTSSAQCQSNDCASILNVCTQACTAGACPEGFSCGDQDQCLQSAGSGSGCAVGARPGRSELLVLLAVALVAMRRARRRT